MDKPKKKRGDRRDGVWLSDLDPLHIIMPYLYPNKADNEAFISETIDLENIKQYLKNKNAQLPEGEEALQDVYVLLAALVKTITPSSEDEPLYQGGQNVSEKHPFSGFVVKKKFADNGEEALAFIEFDENTTMDDVRKKIAAEINSCRGEQVDNSTAGMDMLRKLPRPILRFVMWCLHKLDYYGRAPYSLIKTDPNHATCFITIWDLLV